MILVDTLIWIDHLRQRDERLSGLLDHGRVLVHAFVTGELALGNPKSNPKRGRAQIRPLVQRLPEYLAHDAAPGQR